MNFEEQVILRDIRKALEMLETHSPCTCEEAKRDCGICEKHGLLFINEEQRNAIKEVFGI